MMLSAEQEERMQTNDPTVAMLQIAWEMTREAIGSEAISGLDFKAEWMRKAFQENYRAIREEHQRQREVKTPSFPPE